MLDQALVVKWRQRTEEDIAFINQVLIKVSDWDEEQAYLKLVKWILETDINPHSFMPLGWESSKETASGFSAFVSVLWHDMLDDGDYVFVETNHHGSCLLLCDREEAPNQIKQRYKITYDLIKQYPHTKPLTYELHRDVDRFIQHIEQHKIERQKLSEEHSRLLERLKKDPNANWEELP